MPRYVPLATLQQPPTLEQPGLLVGWSLEADRRRPPVGFNLGNPLRSPDTGYLDPLLLHGEGHLITIAPTGAGKGTGCIVPALLRYEGPVIVIDPKGENVAITARRRREMGQQVVVLDPMGLTEHPSDRFNPLDVVDIRDVDAADHLSALAQALVSGPDADHQNRWWSNRGMNLLVGVMLAVLQEAAEAGRERAAGASLAQVRALLGRSVEDPKAVADLLRESRHPEVQRIATMLHLGSDVTLGGILAYAQEGVDFLRGDVLLEHVGSTTFDLDAVTRGELLSIYLVLPPHMLESHSRLLRLWLTSLIGCITRRRGRPAKGTLLLIDEAAQLGELPQLRQAMTLLRGYGLQAWSFWQDVSQLQHLYPRDWKTMVNNCRVLQCFGALNQAAADDMARLTGFGDGTAVLDLDRDEMLLQLGGDQAVVAQLPNYLSDPAFAGQFDPNPYHDPRREVMPRRSQPQRLYERPRRDPDPHPHPHATLALDDDLLPRLLEKWKRDPMPTAPAVLPSPREDADG